MLVQDIMKHPPLTVASGTSLGDTYRVMQQKKIRHLPVVEGTKLVGVVTDRDLRLATSVLAAHPFAPEARVDDVMTRDVRTAHPMDPMEDAARVMRELKIGCLPVVDGDDLLGIVTGIDLLDALLLLTGVDKPSSRIDVELTERSGELTRLAAFFGARKINIHSMLTWPAGDKGTRALLRVETNQARVLGEALRAEGFSVVWPLAAPWQR